MQFILHSRCDCHNNLKIDVTIGVTRLVRQRKNPKTRGNQLGVTRLVRQRKNRIYKWGKILY